MLNVPQNQTSELRARASKFFFLVHWYVIFSSRGGLLTFEGIICTKSSFLHQKFKGFGILFLFHSQNCYILLPDLQSSSWKLYAKKEFINLHFTVTEKWFSDKYTFFRRLKSIYQNKNDSYPHRIFLKRQTDRKKR